MTCTPWMRQESRQERLRHSLTDCTFSIRCQDLTLAAGAQSWKEGEIPCNLSAERAHHIENSRILANKTFLLSIY